MIQKSDPSQCNTAMLDKQTHTPVSIAVVIPCYNEEPTIANVVQQFRTQLPHAKVYVINNNSSDRSVEEARQAGAIVLHEKRQGKGYVVQAMFRKVDADIYVMVDGDGTYPPDAVQVLIEPILHGEADMVIGSRLHQSSRSDFRFLNRLGNKLFLILLNFIFRVRLTDLLSGYRALNRRLVRSLPLFSGGFEIETEMTIKALQRGFTIVEVPVHLSARPPGSHSKIRLFRDSFLILSTIVFLFRDYKPLTFFGGFGFLLIVLSLLLGIRVTLDYLQTGLVNLLPTALLATGLALTGLLALAVGLILHTIARRFQELDLQLQILTDDLNRRRTDRDRP